MSHTFAPVILYPLCCIGPRYDKYQLYYIVPRNAQSINLITKCHNNLITLFFPGMSLFVIVLRGWQHSAWIVHSWGPFGLTLISAWISNYIYYKLWHEVTYPFPNSSTVEIWELICNFISHFIIYILTYPCWDQSRSMLAKVAPDQRSLILSRLSIKHDYVFALSHCGHSGIFWAICY